MPVERRQARKGDAGVRAGAFPHSRPGPYVTHFLPPKGLGDGVQGRSASGIQSFVFGTVANKGVVVAKVQGWRGGWLEDARGKERGRRVH